MIHTFGSGLLALWLFAMPFQSGDRFGRPTPEFYRDWLCQLDTAEESEWRSIIATLPGGVTFGQEEIRRSDRSTSHAISFQTSFLKGRAQWFSNSPAGGNIGVESGPLAPLFGSVDEAARWIASLGSLRPVPLEREVVRSAFVLFDSSPNDGVMAGSYGRRQSPFSGNIRLEIDNLVAVNVPKNALYAKFSSGPRIRLCEGTSPEPPRSRGDRSRPR